MWYTAVLCLMAASSCIAISPLIYERPPNIEGNPINLCEFASRGYAENRPWYVTYRLTPCSWYERTNVNNIKLLLDLPDEVQDCYQLIAPVHACKTFRGSEGCDRLFERYQFIGPRTYAFHSNLGGLNQGEYVVTDPLDTDRFAVIWTCYRQNPVNPDDPESGKCLDAGIEVLTRDKSPSASVLDDIESNLLNNFSIDLDDLTPVSQSEECEKEDDRAYKICCEPRHKKRYRYRHRHWWRKY